MYKGYNKGYNPTQEYNYVWQSIKRFRQAYIQKASRKVLKDGFKLNWWWGEGEGGVGDILRRYLVGKAVNIWLHTKVRNPNLPVSFI